MIVFFNLDMIKRTWLKWYDTINTRHLQFRVNFVLKFGHEHDFVLKILDTNTNYSVNFIHMIVSFPKFPPLGQSTINERVQFFQHKSRIGLGQEEFTLDILLDELGLDLSNQLAMLPITILTNN